VEVEATSRVGVSVTVLLIPSVGPAPNVELAKTVVGVPVQVKKGVTASVDVVVITGDNVTLVDGLGEGVHTAVVPGEGVTRAVFVTEGVRVVVAVRVRVGVAVRVLVAVAIRVAVAVRVAVGLGVCVAGSYLAASDEIGALKSVPPDEALREPDGTTA
jgi:hypothetical protein